MVASDLRIKQHHVGDAMNAVEAIVIASRIKGKNGKKLGAAGIAMFTILATSGSEGIYPGPTKFGALLDVTRGTACRAERSIAAAGLVQFDPVGAPRRFTIVAAPRPDRTDRQARPIEAGHQSWDRDAQEVGTEPAEERQPSSRPLLLSHPVPDVS